LDDAQALKNTALAYHRLADRYDKRWRGYLEESLGKALSYVQAEGKLLLLDVGCGTGEWIRRLALQVPQATFVGIDPALG
jgi:tRNA G46 methylase TrmB